MKKLTKFLLFSLLLTAGFLFLADIDPRAIFGADNKEPLDPVVSGTQATLTSSPSAKVKSTEVLPIPTEKLDLFAEEPEPTAPVESDGANTTPGIEDHDLEERCGWMVTFQDDFKNASVDVKKWNLKYKSGEKEAQYYVEDAFEVEDGVLKIRAEERQVEDRDYASGALTTHEIFDQLYGRFEVRAKVPAGQGLWPAFWLLASSGNYPVEIDVFEILGHETDIVYMTNHWSDESGDHVFDTYEFSGPDFSEDFHVFEARWLPDEIVWLVDGVERARETNGIPHEPTYMLLNLAVGGEWPGYPDETTPFPSYLEVDYVRAYTWICIGEDPIGDMQGE